MATPPGRMDTDEDTVPGVGGTTSTAPGNKDGSENTSRKRTIMVDPDDIDTRVGQKNFFCFFFC